MDHVPVRHTLAKHLVEEQSQWRLYTEAFHVTAPLGPFVTQQTASCIWEGWDLFTDGNRIPPSHHSTNVTSHVSAHPCARGQLESAISWQIPKILAERMLRVHCARTRVASAQAGSRVSLGRPAIEAHAGCTPVRPGMAIRGAPPWSRLSNEIMYGRLS